MKIKSGDTVQVISGKNKGKKGKVLEALPKEGKVKVEGINVRTKHVKAKKQGQTGQTISVPIPIQASTVLLICSKCGVPTRVGYRKEGDSKFRICKKCKAEV